MGVRRRRRDVRGDGEGEVLGEEGVEEEDDRECCEEVDRDEVAAEEGDSSYRGFLVRRLLLLRRCTRSEGLVVWREKRDGLGVEE